MSEKKFSITLSDFFFEIPPELIAKHPLKKRDECRLLVLRRKSGEEPSRPFDYAQGKRGLKIAHRLFSDILKYLQPGDVLVLNDARVNKSRFFATRPSGGKVEILLCRPLPLSPGEGTSPLQKNISLGSVGANGRSPSPLHSMERGQRGEAVFVGAGSPVRASVRTDKPAQGGGERAGLLGLRPAEPAPTENANVWEAILSHSARVKEGEFLALIPPTNGNVGAIHELPLQKDSISPPRVGEGSGERSGFRILSKQNNRALIHVESQTDIFEKYGTVPIPPYLERPAEKEDEEDYQTVFARTPGASAAPTAGLHFTPELLEKIKSKGVEIVYLSLLVGPGTFEPIRTDDISQHKMHKEYFEIGDETCAKINAAKRAGKRIWAVGTTVVKALETAARNSSPSVSLHQMERDEKIVGAGLRACPGGGGQPRGVAPTDTVLKPFSGDSDLFIHPPFDFQIVDGLITNFHWPRSTLILLVAAFAGAEQIMPAYREAIAQRYRFFSYGDAMLIC